MKNPNSRVLTLLAVGMGLAGCLDTAHETEVSASAVSSPHDCPTPLYGNPWYSTSVMNDYVKSCFVQQNIHVLMREKARDRATNRWNFNISITKAQELAEEFMGYNNNWPGSSVINKWDGTEAFFTTLVADAPASSWLGRNPLFHEDMIRNATEFVLFTECRYWRAVGPNETCTDGYGTPLGVTPNELEDSIGTYWNSIKQGSPSVFDGMESEYVQFLDVRLPQIKAAR